MCILIAEIVMLLGGLYALITGKVTLTRNLKLEGGRARVAGLILASPLPLALGLGLLLGFLVGAGILPQSLVDVAGLIDLVLVVLALIAVTIFGYAVRTKPAPAAAAPPPEIYTG